MKLLPLSDYDLYLFHEGKHMKSYQLLGAHTTIRGGQSGVEFRVWAPNAAKVEVVGDFNRWQGDRHVMDNRKQIWHLFIPGLKCGTVYKYAVYTKDSRRLLKADPYGFMAELRPNTGSIVCELDKHVWQDDIWKKKMHKADLYKSPMLIYEMHFGSWRRKQDNSFMSYRDLADELIPYVKKMGYTHIEIMPLAEHPLDNSWGYQSTGYYAVTSRYGRPEDFMFFVDKCHQEDLGVILDWVPGHFCKDDHGLRQFDGRCVFEHENLLKSENLQWGTSCFNFEKPDIKSFLISNALFWLEVYHVDGLRVDAVASMLYLNYGKKEGEWIPNENGRQENLAAVTFLQELNTEVFKYFPNALMIAEESTTWPLVTRPVYNGGLGFNYKWNMGWMNDILEYMQTDPLYRKGCHHKLTFSMMYAFSENFILALSHDEVVHGKKSMLDKMPGDYWEKFASIRLLYGYMMAHPGKKLIFMGQEFGQFTEWNENRSLDWNVLDYDMHRLLHGYVSTLNGLYKKESSLWQVDDDWHGFVWLDADNDEKSLLSFVRFASKDEFLIIICNFNPVIRRCYRVGVPLKSTYYEILNSDGLDYGGSGYHTMSYVKAEPIPYGGQPYSMVIDVPPLAVLYFKEGRACGEKNVSQ